jgi:hypothetical protein
MPPTKAGFLARGGQSERTGLNERGGDTAGEERKAIVIAVKGGQTKRRWTKLREWL